MPLDVIGVHNRRTITNIGIDAFDRDLAPVFLLQPIDDGLHLRSWNSAVGIDEGQCCLVCHHQRGGFASTASGQQKSRDYEE